MYFQLLHGMHLEGVKRYSTKYEPNEQGIMQCTYQPVVQSDSDLVARFGTNKFRRLSDSEAQSLLLTDKDDNVVGEQNSKDSDPTTSVETDVAKAAKKGAVAVAEPPGKDVTSRFKNVQDTGLKIYRKSKDQYFVCSPDDELLTEDPITKADVEKLIDEWLE
jgi:hypothetical protein